MQDKNKKEKTEYISLLEAAKKSGYAQDYLSLLCRQGKMKGEKIGRNWVTTYQWLDAYQQNLISDMVSEKKYAAHKKDFEKIKNVERITGIKNDILKRIKILKMPKLVLATSLFFLILIGGFSYAKNPQFFSGIAPLEIMSRSLSQLNNNVKKISVSEINLKPKFLTGLIQQTYQIKDYLAYRMSDVKNNIPQTPSSEDFKSFMNNVTNNAGATKNHLAYRMSEMGEKVLKNTSRNIYSRADAGKSIAMVPLKVGEKFGETIINVPMGIGDGIERGFAKSDLVLNSSLRKTHLAIQDSFGPIRNIYSSLLRFGKNISDSRGWVLCSTQISNGVNNLSNRIAALLPSARNDDPIEFKTLSSEDFRKLAPEISPRVAGVSDSVEKNTEVKLPEFFQKFNFRIQLALSDVKDIFERGIILCKTTLTIQRDGGEKDLPTPSAGDFKVAENQKQEAIQISLEGDDMYHRLQGADDQTKDALIVLPSPESEEEKEKLKEKIELSFSDEVEIKPKDATSGIITPVFRESRGDDFIYLMVPIKE